MIRVTNLKSVLKAFLYDPGEKEEGKEFETDYWQAL